MLGHPPPAFQQSPSIQQQPQPQHAQPPTADPNALHHSPPHSQLPGTLTLRLRDESQTVTQPRGRKRKSPATAPTEAGPPPPLNPGAMPPPPPGMLPPLIHPPPHLGGYPMPYPPPPGDYTPGGMPPPHPGHPGGPSLESEQPHSTSSGRTLSQSKRAEQNRKAQRAFRERRDQHVKTLESRSQLLDAALASADEANRRWEECRTIVDQLRIENATLRAALQATQSQLVALNPNANVSLPDPGAVNGTNGASHQRPSTEQPQQMSSGHQEEEEQAPEGQVK